MPEHLIRLLHAAYAAPADGVTDAELLARVVSRDDSAFELLVRRHANLVWRVCRSVARDHHAAEDAFQAAFLALATKAGAVRTQASVAGWLHRVAYHAALRARPRAGDTPLLADPAAAGPTPAEAAETAELGPALHDELNRLPERYRAAVVLCHLDGFSQAEAAKKLGLPVGTVATRVSRGLARLRDRLARRGVAVPAAGAALVAPPELVSAAVRTRPYPAHIVHLSHGALSAMTPSNWKLAVGVAAAAAGLTLAAGTFVAADNPPAPAPAAQPAKPPAPPPRGPATHHQSHRSRENLSRVAVAAHSYHDENNQFPKDIADKAGKPLLSWRVAILPFLDHGFLYKQFKLDEPWDSDHNKRLLPYMPDCFRAPVQPAGATDTYVRAFAGPLAMLDPKERVTFSGVGDGTSITLHLAEAGPPVPWTKPADIPFDPDGDPPALEGPYTDAVHAAWADGSVVRLRPILPARPLKAAITRNQDDRYDPKDLLADPAKPVNDEERKELDRLREALRWEVREATGNADDRFQVEQALRKFGPLPLPDPSAVETLDELAQLREVVQARKWADREEYDRLLAELAKKDPKTAERIEAARQERRLKEAKEREK